VTQKVSTEYQFFFKEAANVVREKIPPAEEAAKFELKIIPSPITLL
jgi:hypothetical protein